MNVRTALIVLWAMTTAWAGEPPKGGASRGELAQHFGFGPFQIYKFEPGIGPLHLADLDADGRTDILVWNGRRSRIELLYQPAPEADVTPAAGELDRNEIPNRGNLRLVTLPLTHKLAALDVADLTGDGRPDIVFFGEPKELVVMPGLPTGGFGAADAIRAPEGTPARGALCTGDFNGDGRADVALRGDELLLVFHQKPEGGLAKPVRLVHGIKSPGLMLSGDFEGDGRLDLIIGADDERYGACVWLQSADGTLGALRPARVPRLRSMTVAPPPAGLKGDDLYAVELATGRLKHYRWQIPDRPGLSADWSQQWHSYPVKSTSKRRPLALGDVDGDGRIDCVSADPDAAQLVLFQGGPAGLGVGRAFPGPVKTTDVGFVAQDAGGQPAILVASAEEKMIGHSRYQDGRLTFPEPLKTRGTPHVLAVGALAPDGPADRLAYVTRTEEGFALVVTELARPTGDEPVLAIDKLDDDPAGLRFVDVDQDGRNDLLLFVRFASPRVFLQAADGTFTPLKGPDTRERLLKEARPEGCAVADVTGSGRPELILAQDNLARALVVEQGRWTVVDQYNAEQHDARVRGVAALPRADGRPMLVMYEQKAGDLLVFEPRADQTYAISQTMPVGSFDLTAMEALPLGDTGRRGVLLADASRLAVAAGGDPAPTLVEQHAYESDVKEAWLSDAVVGDVNHDGVRDVVAVDWGKAALEVLTTPPDGGFVKALSFQVFQGKRFTGAPDSRAEPREVLIGDLTGDRIDDIVLIVHDRVIVYPGQ
ncbi:MAG: VCBS repeat-containing protein [Planctomycetota bacterium]